MEEGSDVVLDLTAEVTDGDGDTTDTSFQVTFDADGNITGTDADEVISGSSGLDIISGGGGDDIIDGGAGDDIIDGGAGADALDGGTGDETTGDTVSYASDTTGVDVDLSLNMASGGDATGDTISNFENVTGGAGNDTLTGDGSDNILLGKAGVDTLEGGAGDDTLTGGAGDYTLTGGADADTFVVGEGDDTITDYNESQDDVVDISDVIDYDANDYLGVLKNTDDDTARLVIFEEGGAEKGSVSFDTIDFDDDLDHSSSPDSELSSLLGQVDVEDGT